MSFLGFIGLGLGFLGLGFLGLGLGFLGLGRMERGQKYSPFFEPRMPFA